MIIKSKKLSVAIAAYTTSLMAMSAPAFAQNESEKDPAALEEVTVTGMRQSMETSVLIKRNTMEIVDSITAEDIGKLPDPNVAEALTRIPGVQGYRYGGEGASPVGEGSGLTIRGLSGQTASRLDGRSYFTAGGREFNIESAIPGMIAGVDVYKNPSAEHIEGGIGGLVNIRTRKPLDFDEFTLSVAASARYNDLAETVKPELFGLFATKWETGVGEMGVLVALNQQESHNRSDSDTIFGRGPQLRRAVRADSAEYADMVTAGAADVTYLGRSDISYLADANYEDYTEAERAGLITALGQEKQVFQEDINRVRKGGNLAFQWRPSDTLEFYANGNYNYYLYDQDYRFMVFGDSRYVQNLETADYNFDEEFMNRNLNGDANELVAGQRLASGTFLGSNLQTWGGHEERPYETWTAAFGTDWQATEKLNVRADLSYIEATQTQDNRRVDFVPVAGLTWDVTRNLMSDIHKLDISGPDLSDPSNFVFRDYHNSSNQQWDDDGWAAQFDFKYQLDLPLLEDIKFGTRYATQQANYRSYSYGGIPLTTDGLPLAADQSNGILVSSMPGVVDKSPTNWLDGDAGYSGGYVVYDPDKLGGNRVRNQFPQAGILEDGALLENLAARRYSEEESLAGYFMADFAYEEFLRGNVGVRVVQTDLYARGMILDRQNNTIVIVPNSERASYVDVLPSLNLTGYIDEDTLLRFGYAKGISRASLGDLNPAVTINADGTASAGNPDLKPLEAHSFDLSLEKYFSGSNYVSAGIFYKDIDGFFNGVKTCESFAGFSTPASNGCGENQFSVTRKVNAEKGSAKGAELAFQSFLDYDFIPEALHNFGVMASYTYLKTENPVDLAGNGVIVDTPMPFQSKNNWTLAGMYEDDFMSARLVYTYRSDFVLFGVDQWPSWARYVEGYGVLDASVNFELYDGLSLSLNASNITNEAPDRYSGEPGGHTSPFSVQHYVNGRNFGLGLRYKF